MNIPAGLHDEIILISTPEKIFRRVLNEEGPLSFSDTEILEALDIKNSTQPRTYVYDDDRLESDMLPATIKDLPDDTTKEILVELGRTIAKARSCITECLRKSGAHVIERQFNQEELLKAKRTRRELHAAAWAPIVGNNLKMVKIKRKWTDNKDPVPVFHHEHIVAETVLKSTDGGRNIITIADDLSGNSTLEELNTWIDLKEKCKFILQAAEGLAYLHAGGYMHGDVCSCNILSLRTESGSYVAKIFDMESVTKIEPGNEKKCHIGRWNYAEEHIYAPERNVKQLIFLDENKPFDEKRDIFALGLVIIKIIGSAKLFEDIGNNRWLIKNSNLEHREKQVMEYVEKKLATHSREIADLVKSMLQKDREKRPTIGEVIDVLKRVFQNLEAS